MKKAPTTNELRLLALIAYQHGEISIGRCAELAGCKRDEIHDELKRRCGKFSPYDEAIREIEELKRINAKMRELLFMYGHELQFRMRLDEGGFTRCCTSNPECEPHKDFCQVSHMAKQLEAVGCLPKKKDETK